MNNYVFGKEKLIQYFSQQELNTELFAEDIEHVISLLIDKDVPDVVLRKSLNLSNCFVPEDTLNHTVEKRTRCLSWRKHSDLDKKIHECKEIEIHLPAYRCSALKQPPYNLIERINGLEINGMPPSNNIIRYLINIQENGLDNLHEFKINNLRHIKDNNKISWYIFSEVCQFEFGPFKTDKIIELYNEKIINKYTRIRLTAESYEMITDKLKESPLEFFLIKDLCNVFCIKEKCKYKAKLYEDEESIYKMSLKRKTTFDHEYIDKYYNDYYIENKNKTPRNKRK
jgi:hypothetical protein